VLLICCLLSRWYDGFSTFYVGGDGLVYRHVADKVCGVHMRLDHSLQVLVSVILSVDRACLHYKSRSSER